MATLGKKSLERLATCHPDLQRLVKEVVKEYDITVLEGHRGEKEQNEAFEKGNSKVRWPNGKHNKIPSEAVDIAPYPIDWNNLSRFKEMGEIVKRKATELGINIAWGGEWKTLKDYPHFELA